MANAKQIPLFDAETEARLYHDPARFGFFSVLYSAGYRKEQRSYRLPLMGEVLRLLPKDRDTWLSQAEFCAPNRRVVNLSCLTSLFVNVDCYKIRMAPTQAEALLLLKCEENGLPMPSLVIQSGRGIQVKWLLEKPLPRQALPRWNAAQRELVEMFLDIGADPAAKDASRVLRLVETVNTKSGETVKVSWANTTNGAEVAAYDFDFLCEYLLPFSREQLADMRAARKQKKDDQRDRCDQFKVIDGNATAKRGFSNRQLAWHRLEDLRTLYRIRQGNIDGLSMPLLFWSLNFLLLSGATNPTLMYHEAGALCREFGMGEFKRKDELGTLYAKAKDFEAGRMVTHNGRSYPALYTPRNSTLIDIFQIEPEEQRQLRTIIGEVETKDRHRTQEEARRRAAGAVTRDTYLAANDLKRVEARTMAAQGMAQGAIAISLDVSRRTVIRWLHNGL